MRKIHLIPWAIVIGVFIACAGAPAPSAPGSPPPPATLAPAVITLEEFHHLREGMTYEEVVAVVGAPGVLTSNTEVAGHQAATYRYDGASLGANAIVMFQNGRLTSHAQFGLT